MSYYLFWSIMNNIAPNIHIQLFVLVPVFKSFAYISRSHKAILCLTFWGTAKLSSRVTAPFDIPTSNAWELQLPYPCQYILYFFAYLSGNKVASHCTLIHVSNDIDHHVLITHLFIFSSVEKVYLNPLPIFNEVTHFPIEFGNYFSFLTQVSYQIYDLQILSSIL